MTTRIYESCEWCGRTHTPGTCLSSKLAIVGASVEPPVRPDTAPDAPAPHGVPGSSSAPPNEHGTPGTPPLERQAA